MSTTLIEVRQATVADATSNPHGAHDEAWRAAYQGIIPGAELAKLINRRGPALVVERDPKGQPCQRAGVWRTNRRLRQLREEPCPQPALRRRNLRALPASEFQGLGFGRRLFTAAKRDLVQSGLKSMVVWALSDNEPALDFYRDLGGHMVAKSSEQFGRKVLDKVAFSWTH